MPVSQVSLHSLHTCAKQVLIHTQEHHHNTKTTTDSTCSMHSVVHSKKGPTHLFQSSALCVLCGWQWGSCSVATWERWRGERKVGESMFSISKLPSVCSWKETTLDASHSVWLLASSFFVCSHRSENLLETHSSTVVTKQPLCAHFVVKKKLLTSLNYIVVAKDICGHDLLNLYILMLV